MSFGEGLRKLGFRVSEGTAEERREERENVMQNERKRV